MGSSAFGLAPGIQHHLQQRSDMAQARLELQSLAQSNPGLVLATGLGKTWLAARLIAARANASEASGAADAACACKTRATAKYCSQSKATVSPQAVVATISVGNERIRAARSSSMNWTTLSNASSDGDSNANTSVSHS